MHLPDGIIPLNQAIRYTFITIIILFIYFYKFTKTENVERSIVYIALWSTITFLLTSLSIPSPFGVPIHFFLIPLVTVILGPVRGIFCSLFSLLAQTLILGMGGLLAFGANFIVMGFVISISTYTFYNVLLEINEKIALFTSTLIGIFFAVLAQSIILVLSGSITFDVILSTLIPYYLFISIIEGILNLMIMGAIKKVKPEILEI